MSRRDAKGLIELFIFILLMIILINITRYEHNQSAYTIPTAPKTMLFDQLVEHKPANGSYCGTYSINYKGVNNKMETIVFSPNHNLNAEVFIDAPADKHIWVDFERATNIRGEVALTGQAKIHVHSLDEVQGGNWNHGKGGRGQNVVIETDTR